MVYGIWCVMMSVLEWFAWVLVVFLPALTVAVSRFSFLVSRFILPSGRRDVGPSDHSSTSSNRNTNDERTQQHEHSTHQPTKRKQTNEENETRNETTTNKQGEKTEKQNTTWTRDRSNKWRTTLEVGIPSQNVFWKRRVNEMPRLSLITDYRWLRWAHSFFANW